MQLRFASFAVINLRRDLHPQECAHAGRTNEKGLQTEICNPLIMLVRPAGFEPTTPWFVARYSIHLSYGRL